MWSNEFEESESLKVDEGEPFGIHFNIPLASGCPALQLSPFPTFDFRH